MPITMFSPFSVCILLLISTQRCRNGFDPLVNQAVQCSFLAGDCATFQVETAWHSKPLISESCRLMIDEMRENLCFPT